VTSPVAHHCVFMFDRRDEKLVALGPVGYASAAEAEEKAKAIAPLFAGALAVTLTKDQATGELLEAKVLIQVGEADFAALVGLFGET
jgi:hypothetical protein